MDADALDREEALHEARYADVMRQRRQWIFHCPRCQRGISNPKLLDRPHWREDGPRICSTCISWEQTWERIEEGRIEAIEHARKR